MEKTKMDDMYNASEAGMDVSEIQLEEIQLREEAVCICQTLF
jgi:hypothetical protein